MISSQRKKHRPISLPLSFLSLNHSLEISDHQMEKESVRKEKIQRQCQREKEEEKEKEEKKERERREDG